MLVKLTQPHLLVESQWPMQILLLNITEIFSDENESSVACVESLYVDVLLVFWDRGDPEKLEHWLRYKLAYISFPYVAFSCQYANFHAWKWKLHHSKYRSKNIVSFPDRLMLLSFHSPSRACTSCVWQNPVVLVDWSTGVVRFVSNWVS